jgi:hypothetical protein
MLVVVEALLRLQVLVCGIALGKKNTHPGGDRGNKEDYDCLDPHSDGVQELEISI